MSRLWQQARRFANRQRRPALASSRSAASTCICSIISPSNRSAPPVAAATSRSARSISSSVGAKAHGRARSGLGGSATCRRSRAAALRPPRRQILRDRRAGCRRRRTPQFRRPARPAQSTAAPFAAVACPRPAAAADRRQGRWSRRSAPAASWAMVSAANTPLAVSIIASTGSPVWLRTKPSSSLVSTRGTTTASGLSMHDGDDVRPMPFGVGAVDPDRDRHRPWLLDRRDRRLARGILVLRLHRILKVEDDQVGIAFARLRDGARVAGRQEQQRPLVEQVDASCRFSFTHSPKAVPS